MDLPLNNQQRLICHKTQTTKQTNKKLYESVTKTIKPTYEKRHFNDLVSGRRYCSKANVKKGCFNVQRTEPKDTETDPFILT